MRPAAASPRGERAAPAALPAAAMTGAAEDPGPHEEGPGPDAEGPGPDEEGPGPDAEGQGLDEEAAPRIAAVPLLEPRDGMRPLVGPADALADATQRLGGGSGPVAVDAERASGFRYGHRAFLVQFRRAGAGTVLVDPVACPDLSGIDTALTGTEAVLHAAGQDLPCLTELGFRPRQLFDTELAGRLLGYP